MELVYLWVKEYKNIHNQGFNFSPRFRCEYDPDSNELTIVENTEYVDIFPENINVTAIVGKNGSGKSSVLEFLRKNWCKLNYIVIYAKQGEVFCEYKTNKRVEVESTFGVKVIELDKCNDLHNSQFFPKSIDIANDKKIGKDNLFTYYFGEYTGFLRSWTDGRPSIYDMTQARFFVPRYTNIALDKPEFFKSLNQMYQFDTLRLILRNNSMEYLYKLLDKERKWSYIYDENHHTVCIKEKTDEMLKTLQQNIHVPLDKLTINIYDKRRENIIDKVKQIENTHRRQRYKDPASRFNKYLEFDLAVLIAFFEYYLKYEEPCASCEKVYNELSELVKNFKKYTSSTITTHDKIATSYILDFFEYLQKSNFSFTKDEPQNNLITIDEIIEAIKYIQQFEVHYFDEDGNLYIDIPIDKYLKENIKHIKIFQKIFFDYEFDVGNEKYLRVFEYDLINKEIGSTYQTISDGEKQFVKFGIDLIYYLENLKKDEYYPNLVQILADEPDNALHPVWKKLIIKNSIDIFEKYMQFSKNPEFNIHFIFTTHSPFLLSDIPKQSIIFLDTDEKGNCIVVDGLKEKKETFGANIHTLLSDSFFMEGGLMGEFAKSKIDEVIKSLNKETLNEDALKYCEKIISIIGEPIVKNQLQRMLDSKRHKKVDDKIDRLKQSIEEMQKRLDELENDKNSK